MNDYDAVYDTVIEVLNSEPRKLLASTRIPLGLAKMPIADGLAGAYVDSTGIARVELLRLAVR